jgi:CheY-like chemotaxis protein
MAHILLVDDNALGLAARKSVLEEHGYRIITASSGHEALSLLSEHRFELMVTDFKMPRMSGLELISEVRKIQPNLSIILLSGFAESMGLSETGTGADAVIQKSATEVQYLLRTVNRLLRKKAAKKPATGERAKAKSHSQAV